MCLTTNQIYTITYILEQNNKPGYKVYMPTYKHWYKTHSTLYKDVEYEDVDKRSHGWADICIKSKDGEYKYYKFIKVFDDKLYYGWLKKWNNLPDNHYVVIYTDRNNISKNTYAMCCMNTFSENYVQFTDSGTIRTIEGVYLNKFDTRKSRKIDFLPSTSTKRILDVSQCFQYGLDNKHEYLIHKSCGYHYVYNKFHYNSLSELYESTIFKMKYYTLSAFRKAYQRGKIQDIEKYSSLIGGRATPPNPLKDFANASSLHSDTSQKNATVLDSDEQSESAFIDSEKTETVSNKSESTLNKSITTNPKITICGGMIVLGQIEEITDRQVRKKFYKIKTLTV